MCSCKEDVIARAEAKENRLMSATSGFEGYGHSTIRMQGYRKSDGAPSQTFLYGFEKWTHCPFCGVRLSNH